MKCPKCVELGLKSECRENPFHDLHDLMPDIDNFYDPLGNFHKHTKTVRRGYRCTNKHYFYVGGTPICYPGSPKEVQPIKNCPLLLEKTVILEYRNKSVLHRIKKFLGLA